MSAEGPPAMLASIRSSAFQPPPLEQFNSELPRHGLLPRSDISPVGLGLDPRDIGDNEYTPRQIHSDPFTRPYLPPMQSRPATSISTQSLGNSSSFVDLSIPPSPDLYQYPTHQPPTPSYPPYYNAVGSSSSSSSSALPPIYPNVAPPYSMNPPSMAYSPAYPSRSPITSSDNPILPPLRHRPPFPHHHSTPQLPTVMWTGNLQDTQSSGPGWNIPPASPLPFYSPNLQYSSYPPPDRLARRIPPFRDYTPQQYPTTDTNSTIDTFDDDVDYSPNSSNNQMGSFSDGISPSRLYPITTTQLGDHPSLSSSPLAEVSHETNPSQVGLGVRVDERDLSEESRRGKEKVGGSTGQGAGGGGRRRISPTSHHWGIPQNEYLALPVKDKKQIRNKIGARRFRAKRKDYIATLEETIGERDEEIQSLKNQILSLQADINKYRHDLQLSPLPVSFPLQSESEMVESKGGIIVTSLEVQEEGGEPEVRNGHSS